MRKGMVRVIFSISLFLSGSIFGQSKVDTYFDFYLIPQDMAVAMKASRSGLPVELEKVELFTNLTGSIVKCAYQFKNIGSKPVRGIEVAVIDRRLFRLAPSGMQSRYADLVDFSIGPNIKDVGLAPGASFNYDQKLERGRKLPIEIVSRIKSFPSRIKAKFIVALVITRIEFSDGTTLDLRSDADDIELLFEGDRENQ